MPRQGSAWPSFADLGRRVRPPLVSPASPSTLAYDTPLGLLI